MRRARFVLIAVTTLLCACGPGVPPSQNYASVSGRVFDAATNAPIAGALITVSTVLTATSAADGTYRVTPVPVGPNEVIIQPPSGYSAAQTQFAISPQPGEAFVQNIPLTKSP